MSTSPTSGEREHTLPLPNNRQIAYADNGNRRSTTVVLFFSGYFSVGNASYIPATLRALDVHFVAPTLPGNGDSSSIKDGPYNLGLCRDITALLEHLHPEGGEIPIRKLYVGGGSYGTVQAQMLYGAPYDLFPQGRRIAGLLLGAPFSPFRLHKGYGRAMTWQNWISVGPFSQWFPFRAVPRLVSIAAGSKVKDVPAAKKFMREFIVSPMDDGERRLLEGWLEGRGLTEDEWVGRMAQGAVRCTKNWDGFLEGSDVVHSDWGFVPRELDEEHRKPVLIVGSDKDELGRDMIAWLKENYANSAVKMVPGGHIASLFYMDEIWSELIAMEH